MLSFGHRIMIAMILHGAAILVTEDLIFFTAHL